MSLYYLVDKYVFIIAPFIGWFLAQFLKPFTHLFVTKEWKTKLWFTSSGMPSSHTSTIVGLATILGAKNGWDSSEFAITSILSLIIMYDAKGVRRASGDHAAYLNDIMDDINEFFKNGINSNYFKTELGHTGLQVFGGMILGIITSLCFSFYFNYL